MSESELRPCPFCGQDTLARECVDGQYLNGWIIECCSCEGRGPEKETEADAVDAWNRRPSPPPSLGFDEWYAVFASQRYGAFEFQSSEELPHYIERVFREITWAAYQAGHSAALTSQQSEIERLKNQLPVEMQSCTILFKKCPTCERDEMRGAIKLADEALTELMVIMRMKQLEFHSSYDGAKQARAALSKFIVREPEEKP